MMPAPSSLPFRVGESPFKIKGNNYKGSIVQYDALVPGGYKAVCASLEDPALRAYVSQEFYTGSWYDIYPIVYLDERAAALSGRSFDEFVRACCEMQAKLDITGVYRVILGFVSPETCVKRMTGFTGQYFNFSKHALTLEGSKASFVTTGVPMHMGPWFCKALGYYVGTVIRHSGATDTTFVFHDAEAAEMKDGVQLCTLRWEIRWRKA